MYVITHLFVFVTLPMVILVSFLEKEWLPSMKRWFVKTLFAIVGKNLKVTGFENVVPHHAYLIISNYPSFYAGFSLMGAFPRASVVTQAFLKKIPLLGVILSRAGAVFVQSGREGRGKSAIDLHISRRDENQSIIILPEGERTPNGEIHRFRRGFVYLLRQTTLDLLPVTLNGLYQLKPMRRFYADPDVKPEMIIHSPLSNAMIHRMTDDELLRSVQTTISGDYQP